jgi:hypothetical protein
MNLKVNVWRQKKEEQEKETARQAIIDVISYIIIGYLIWHWIITSFACR